MLLPQAWLRQQWLQQALRGYPLYDPPHKVEERLLSREKAAENFDYFMRVRERLGNFQEWLRRHFGVTVTLDERGVRALSRWGNKYAGHLLVTGPDGHPNSSYFTYSPPWTGVNASYNVLFDMGITLGEAIIANCPKLRWDVDPTWTILPNQTRALKQTSGTSFQRPMLTGFDNPVFGKIPLHDVDVFADQMMRNMMTFEGIQGYLSRHREVRRLIREQILNIFRSTLEEYPAGDPHRLRKQMSSDDYLKLVDSEYAQGNSDDD